jgi:hypothetical protein
LEKLRSAARHLRWAPHRLPDNQKAIRVQCSKSFLTILQREDIRDWQDIVTLDKSWFGYIKYHEGIWLPPRGKVPDRECVAVSFETVLAIAQGLTWFAVVAAIENECRFNTGYCVSKMLTRFYEWLC